MRERATSVTAPLRGFTAVLMVAVISIVSFSAVVARAVQASLALGLYRPPRASA